MVFNLQLWKLRFIDKIDKVKDDVKTPCADFISVDVNYKRLKKEITKFMNKRKNAEQEEENGDDDDEPKPPKTRKSAAAKAKAKAKNAKRAAEAEAPAEAEPPKKPRRTRASKK